MYMSERDMLYLQSLTMLHNQGLRFYINFQYKVNQRIDLWLKVSNLYYFNSTTIGSDYDEINGPLKTE